MRHGHDTAANVNGATDPNWNQRSARGDKCYSIRRNTILSSKHIQRNRSTRVTSRTSMFVEQNVMNELQLTVGRTYRAKTPRVAGTLFNQLYNDRTIKWIGRDSVQYDGPSVKFGRKYPTVTRDQFTKWASHDVTDQLPPGEYQPWDNNKKC